MPLPLGLRTPIGRGIVYELHMTSLPAALSTVSLREWTVIAPHIRAAAEERSSPPNEVAALGAAHELGELVWAAVDEEDLKDRVDDYVAHLPFDERTGFGLDLVHFSGAVLHGKIPHIPDVLRFVLGIIEVAQDGAVGVAVERAGEDARGRRLLALAALGLLASFVFACVWTGKTEAAVTIVVSLGTWIAGYLAGQGQERKRTWACARPSARASCRRSA